MYVIIYLSVADKNDYVVVLCNDKKVVSVYCMLCSCACCMYVVCYVCYLFGIYISFTLSMVQYFSLVFYGKFHKCDL